MAKKKRKSTKKRKNTRKQGKQVIGRVKTLL
jgi:hypothetical protein